MTEIEVYRELMQDPKAVFVFGSNLGGHHGAGAAREAFLHYGAKTGFGYGPMGRSYAIPTKSIRMTVRPLHNIAEDVDIFLSYAAVHTDHTFVVTRIGCGLAGYRNEDIAPMFKNVPDNVILPSVWTDP